MDLTGNFLGHLLPGLGFFGWAAVWTAARMRPGAPPRPTRLEEHEWIWGVKLTVVLAAVAGEVFAAATEHRGVDFGLLGPNNFQHILMWIPFGLSGLVDRWERAGRASPAATYAVAALACIHAGFVFGTHGHMGGLPDQVHLLLAGLFVVMGLGVAAEGAWPAAGWFWLRTGAAYALGLWFMLIGWILYRSGWDLMGHVQGLWAMVLFSAILVTVGTAVLLLYRLSPSRR